MYDKLDYGIFLFKRLIIIIFIFISLLKIYDIIFEDLWFYYIPEKIVFSIEDYNNKVYKKLYLLNLNNYKYSEFTGKYFTDNIESEFDRVISKKNIYKTKDFKYIVSAELAESKNIYILFKILTGPYKIYIYDINSKKIRFLDIKEAYFKKIKIEGVVY